MPATIASFAPRPSRHVTSCMFIVVASVSRSPLAAREQLLEGVREQLVRCHVLTPPEQFAGGDLVENGRHLVVAQQAVEHVAFKFLHGLL